MENSGPVITVTDTEDLLYTTRGRLPSSMLAYQHSWEEDDRAICFVEEYRLNGELVRRNVHQKLKQGLQTIPEQPVFA
jgi:hypothetical protein